PLDLDSQGEIATDFLLFDDPIRQPRVLHHQRELIGTRWQDLLLRRAEPSRSPEGPSSRTPRISLLVRNGTAVRTSPVRSQQISSTRSGRCSSAHRTKTSTSARVHDS